MYNWIHIIKSVEDFKNLWNTIFNVRELHLGRFIIIDGSLSCNDGRVFGNENEKLAGITTYTYQKEIMERLIDSGKIDSSSVVLIKELASEELNKHKNLSNMIRKEIKDFEGPTVFKNYLRSINYKDFKFEDQ